MNADVVTIRRAAVSDAAAIAAIYNEAIATTTATFDTDPKTPEERIRWLKSHDERHPILVADAGGAVVGWASLTAWSDRTAYDNTAETSFYVQSACRGRGIGRKLQEALLEQAERNKFHTLIARISDGSSESLHLHEATGFIRIGTMKEVGRKFGKLIDVHILQKMLG
jgi:L-amino acid N-acyltransferase YncA